MRDAAGIETVTDEEVAAWIESEGPLEAYRRVTRAMGGTELDPGQARTLLGIGPALGLAIETVLDEDREAPPGALDSIPLHSLARGVYLPLSGMTAEAVGRLFGIAWAPPGGSDEELVLRFVARDIGLALDEKVGILTGDPFGGQPSGVGFDSLVAVLSRLAFEPPESILARLPKVGDLGLLFIELTERLRSDPPIPAREALAALRGLPRVPLKRRRMVLADLFERAGRLERYFLYRLVRRRLSIGLRFKMDLVWKAIGQRHGLDPDRIAAAAAIHDHLDLARIIEREGERGLKRIVLRPLSPVLPALAGGQLEPATARWPLWIERKYDGIRIMAHRQAARHGQPMVALYTRRAKDWTLLLPELAETIRQLPVPAFILDGELHGEVVELDGLRQASVYETYKAITSGERGRVRFRYTAFDLLYLNGADLTGQPLYHRRRLLEQAFGPLAGLPFPLPFGLSDGQSAGDHSQFKVLFQHFRNQGFEGAMAKVPDSPYFLGARRSDWLKKKPEITLDLALSGAFWSGRESAQPAFGAFRLSARSEEQGWVEVGTVAALDQATNEELARRIIAGNLFTGKTLSHQSADGTRVGFELSPEILVTVRFEGVVRDEKGALSLRDPKIVAVRSDELPPEDADTDQAIESLFLRERLG